MRSSQVPILQKMEAMLARCGVSLDGVSFTLGGAPTIHIHSEGHTPANRETLVGELGEPNRPAWDKKNADWKSKEGYRVVAFDWPWPTCESCGQLKPSDSPVPSGG